ncbi:MAG: tetraacyldisaccharide 4'-kinase [Acidobacteria bacterium]|jgi:tetraacyldisaccharide 4'-kinase|nr:tetraacyldisaccharide 4'-kinase [Acidobacteriota bacterium]MDP7338160.1 tetraacyldisaccharide 4'-kinase [Vicinamibacterales bacterium]MDP7478003.1 tetraacyldisaccharide 4'-kinase [Vicinamibacterales bacterium]MDP7690448.1 tetraacyldisaccharide 4'-kinase [Vicinamibacterales bacterium]HJN43477.1 tetraacyldisaccharide 4'-kinase [Vicinamibacterales bacterium]
MRRLLSRLYDEAAWRRRQWYARRPEARRRLRRPVFSVGALAAGGSGKTPLTAHLARTLLAMGERPSVLSRGFGRARAVAGAVVVRDSERIVGELATAGDEPWMLAQALDGVAVVVASDRYLAGRLAETHLGATVHLLDDGFQHLPLERGTDLLVVAPADLDDPAVLPAGRLRERVATARCADAVLVDDGSDERRDWVAERLGLSRSFTVRRRVGPAVVVSPHAEPEELGLGARVIAVAGIARPERFFGDVRQAGFDVLHTLVYRDHHRYSPRDAARIQVEARTARAEAIVTTDKDGVRLKALFPFAPPLATLPLTLCVEPADEFRAYLADRLVAERTGEA